LVTLYGVRVFLGVLLTSITRLTKSLAIVTPVRVLALPSVTGRSFDLGMLEAVTAAPVTRFAKSVSLVLAVRVLTEPSLRRSLVTGRH
jgi:hypothetical protein